MRSVVAVVCAAGLVASMGCGGGGATAGDPFAAGRSAIYGMAAGDAEPTRAGLGSALRLLERAMAAQPDSSEAKWWAAVCLVGLAGLDAGGVETAPGAPGDPTPVAWGSGGAGSADGSTVADPGDHDIPALPPDYDGSVPPVEPPYRIGLVWNLRHTIANPYTFLTLLAPLTDIRFGLVSLVGYPGDDPAARMAMLARLDEADRLLTQVEEDAGFMATLPDPERDGGSIVLDLAEVRLFHAYVNIRRAETALSLAYVRDIGPLWPGAVAADALDSGVWNPYRGMDRNHDGFLTPEEYLPGNPFLTLRAASYLRAAQSAMSAAAELGRMGCEAVLARPASTGSASTGSADGGYLIENAPPYREALIEMRDAALPLIRQAAIGPVDVLTPHYEVSPTDGTAPDGRPCAAAAGGTFELDPDPGDCYGWGEPRIVMRSVRLNLAAWFADPPGDLKTLAPTLGLGNDGWPDSAKVRFPDVTFAGLFPEGIKPEDWFYGPVVPMPMAAGWATPPPSR
jgi:hypothetical protein